LIDCEINLKVLKEALSALIGTLRRQAVMIWAGVDIGLGKLGFNDDSRTILVVAGQQGC
jgi:hypothetical protein